MKLRIELDIGDGDMCRGCAYQYIIDTLENMRKQDKNLQETGHARFGRPNWFRDGSFLILEGLPPMDPLTLTREEAHALPIISRVFIDEADFDSTRQSKESEADMRAFRSTDGESIDVETVLKAVAESERSN